MSMSLSLSQPKPTQTKGPYYRREWESEPWAFGGWLMKAPYDSNKAFCNWCKKELTCKKSDLLRHKDSSAHSKLSPFSDFTYSGQPQPDINNASAPVDLDLDLSCEPDQDQPSFPSIRPMPTECVDPTLDEYTQRKKTHPKSSPVWLFFERKNSGAECRICSRFIKIVNHGTSSLLRHVKKKHQAEYNRKLRAAEIQARVGGAAVSPVAAPLPTAATSGGDVDRSVHPAGLFDRNEMARTPDLDLRRLECVAESNANLLEAMFPMLQNLQYLMMKMEKRIISVEHDVRHLRGIPNPQPSSLRRVKRRSQLANKSGTPSGTPLVDQSDSETIQVEVVDLDNKSLTIDVTTSDTVSELKNKIETKNGMPAASLELQFDQTILEDKETLAHYNIDKYSKIDIIGYEISFQTEDSTNVQVKVSPTETVAVVE